MIMPFVISLKIFQLIHRKGTSNDLKHKILKRHFIYLGLFLLWELRILYDNPYNSYFLLIIPDIAGFFMGFIRLIMEPYVFYLIKKFINKLFCSNIKIKKTKVSTEALCSLTNSALNVELVYAIIVGINSLMENNDQNKVPSNTCIIRTSGQDTFIKMNNIKVEELEMLDIK